MRFTRQLPDRRSFTVALALSSCVAVIVAAAGCSSSDEAPSNSASADGASDTSFPSIDDASPRDAGPSRDAGSFDAAPLDVTCESASCAKALVTTFGQSDDDRGEGFCALLGDGTVACWGANRGGQLGRGEEAGALESATPARVVGLTGIRTLQHTCAIDVTGSTFCWGTGPFRWDETQPPMTTTERSPVELAIPPATRIGATTSTACALVTDGVLCWGANESGQVAPFEVASWSDVLAPTPVVGAGAPLRDLVVGNASFVSREDGTMASWGANPPLGRVSSLFPDPYPQSVVLHGISSLDVAGDNACAVADGVGYCWGAVVSTSLDPPSGPLVDRALPEVVVTPEPIVQIATTRNVVYGEFDNPTIEPQRWCASAASGAVYCAGYNASGQAGDGTTSFASKAQKVVGLPAPAAQIKTTPNTTCALLTNGKVFCWGGNFYGQLGVGTFKVPSLVPQEVMLP